MRASSESHGCAPSRKGTPAGILRNLGSPDRLGLFIIFYFQIFMTCDDPFIQNYFLLLTTFFRHSSY